MESNNKSVFGTIAGAVKALCLSLISLLTVADEGIAMADKAVRVYREKQAIELDIGMSEYVNTAILKAAAEQAKAQEALKAYVDADTSGERKKLLDASITRLKAAVERGQNEIQMQRQARKF